MMKRKIQFTAKNLNDVFFLPCVKCIMKYEAIGTQEPILILDRTMVVGGSKITAQVGDTLVQFDNGKWAIE